MTPQEFQSLIFSNSDRIASAVTTGSAWELWMQAELCLLVRGSGLQAARELPYPNSNQKLDLGFRDSQGIFAVEMKVESATNAREGLRTGLSVDIEKIRFYNVEGLFARWVVGLAYSADGLRVLQKLSTDYPGSTFKHQASIGIIVINVT